MSSIDTDQDGAKQLYLALEYEKKLRHADPGDAVHVPMGLRSDIAILVAQKVLRDRSTSDVDTVVPSPAPAPERVRILHDGAALTNGDRDDEYGPPFNNMTCAGELKAAFRKWLARDIRPGELEAIDMALTKISRLACGKPKRDTYVDAATYMAIAGEVALKE